MNKPEFTFALEPYQLFPSVPIDKIVGDLFKSDFTARLAPTGDPFANGWNAAMQYMKEHPTLPTLPLPVNVIFHNPATIVYWSDGTKTVVKCQPGDTFSAETGLTTAMLKKYMGNDNTFNRVINEWLRRTGQYQPPLTALPASEVPALPEATPPVDGDSEVAE